MRHMNGVGWEWWLVMSIGVVALWALFVLAVVALLRWMSGAERELLPKARRELVDRLAR